MASTVPIQSTFNWASAYILQRPSAGVGLAFQEPALTISNSFLETVLAPPFAWQWNRNENTSVSVAAGISDYTIANMTDFGWLEKATLTYGISPPLPTPPIIELEIATVLTISGKENRPFKICPIKDDNAGNITFRLFPVPDQSYQLNLTYQKSPPFITTLYNSTIGSITSIGAVNGLAQIYTCSGGVTGGTGNALANTYFQVSGTTKNTNGQAVNDGLFFCLGSSSTTITLQNSLGIAQAGAGGTVFGVSTWKPIPDKYGFLYDRYVKAMLNAMYDSATYVQEMGIFWKQLVGCSEGLSDMAKAIFLEDKLSQLRTEAYYQNATTANQKKS